METPGPVHPKRPLKLVVKAIRGHSLRRKSSLERNAKQPITALESVFLAKMKRQGMLRLILKMALKCHAQALFQPRIEARAKSPKSNEETIQKASTLDPSTHHSSLSLNCQHGPLRLNTRRLVPSLSMATFRIVFNTQCLLNMGHQLSNTIMCR